MKRILVLSLTLCIALSMLGCVTQTPAASGSGNDGTAQSAAPAETKSPEEFLSVVGTGSKNGNVTMGKDSDKKTMIVASSNSLDTLDPFYVNNEIKAQLSGLCYDTLWDLAWGTTGEVGNCAKTWTMAEDRRTWTVEIYDSIYDSEGNNITAYDFEWAQAYSKENSPTSNPRITSITAKDKYLLEVVMKDEYYPGALASCNTVAIHKESYLANPERFRSNPIVTGQYICVDFTSGASATFMQRYEYWNDPGNVVNYRKANVDVVRFDVITEASQIRNGLEAGDIQFAKVNQNNANELLKLDKVAINQIPAQFPYFFIFNMYAGSVFSDNRALREAIAYALDYESLCYSHTSGAGTYYGTFGYSALVGYNPEWRKLALHRDVEKAKAFLQEAGYKPGELKLRYLTNTKDDVAVIVQANLAEIGIDMEISELDAASYTAARNDASKLSWDLCWSQTGHKGYMSIHLESLLLGQFKLPDGSLGCYCGLFDKELYNKARDSRSSSNQADIDEVYYELFDRLWYLPTWDCITNVATNKKIEGVAINYNLVLFPNACTFADDYDVYYK